MLFLQLDLLLWPQHSVHNDVSSKILFKNSHNFHSWVPMVPICLPFEFYPETKKWKRGGIAGREVLFLQLDLLLWPQHSVHNDASSKLLFKNSHNFHSWAPMVPICLPFEGGNVLILP